MQMNDLLLYITEMNAKKKTISIDNHDEFL